jgi:hypothetical protein
VRVPPPRTPHPRLVELLAPFLGKDALEHAFVAQVGRNPAFAIAALPLGILSLFVPTGTTLGLGIAVMLSTLFVIWVFAVFIPMKSRVVAVTKREIVVLDATKLRFRPKAELRRLPRTHRLGEVKGFLTARIDLGDGEQAWVFKGYSGTIDAIDSRFKEKLLPESVGVGLPPRQRFSGWFKRDR